MIRLLGFLRNNPTAVWLTVTIAGGLVAYLLGIKFLLPIIFIAIGVFYLPMPVIFNSWVSRVFVSGIASVCLLQAIAMLQFLLLSDSDFGLVAVMESVLWLGAIWYLKPSNPEKIINKNDIFALLAGMIFLIPFLAVLFGQNTTYSITSIGGLQSADAEHHFEFINSMVDQQRLDTSGYPKNFHLAVGFLQDSVLPTQQQLSWQQNVAVFFSHYAIFGFILAFFVYYFCVALIAKLAPGIKKTILFNFSVLVALILPIAVLFLWPFWNYGFLNYYFTVVAIIVGLIALLSGKKLLAVLAFFGAAASWTLVAPPLILAMLFFVDFKNIFTRQNFAVAAGMALIALPVLSQILYPPATAEINAHGVIRTFDVLVILAGVIGVTFVLLKNYSLEFKKVVIFGFVPFFILTLGLAAMQFFILGEVRYYTIKVALLLQIMLVILGVAIMFGGLLKQRLNLPVLAAACIAPMLVMMLLLSANDNPFKGMRDLFRDYSGQGRPAFYGQDAFNYATLGEQGRIDHFNSTVLHYNKQDSKITAHSLLAQWVQFMKFDRVKDVNAKSCHRDIYGITANGDGSRQEQIKLTQVVQRCIDISNQYGYDYYVVTDRESVEHLKSVFKGKVIYLER